MVTTVRQVHPARKIMALSEEKLSRPAWIGNTTSCCDWFAWRLEDKMAVGRCLVD